MPRVTTASEGGDGEGEGGGGGGVDEDEVAKWRGHASLKEASDSITRLFCKRCLVNAHTLSLGCDRRG